LGVAVMVVCCMWCSFARPSREGLSRPILAA
jgi:hypothetical protein